MHRACCHASRATDLHMCACAPSWQALTGMRATDTLTERSRATLSAIRAVISGAGKREGASRTAVRGVRRHRGAAALQPEAACRLRCQPVQTAPTQHTRQHAGAGGTPRESNSEGFRSMSGTVRSNMGPAEQQHSSTLLKPRWSPPAPLTGIAQHVNEHGGRVGVTQVHRSAKAFLWHAKNLWSRDKRKKWGSGEPQALKWGCKDTAVQQPGSLAAPGTRHQLHVVSMASACTWLHCKLAHLRSRR